MNVIAAMVASAALLADPSPDEKLLQTFREEFIEIVPGKTKLADGKLLAATFEMGSDENGPVHRVEFSRAFSIARYEVTQELYQAIMGDNPSRWKGPRNSVEMVSFDDAMEFCKRASVRLRELKLIEADQVVRLPTEAEWEYTVRAGTASHYSFGDDADSLGEYGWFTGNAKGNDPPVGAKKPNPLGLYDVHGYLWEWCADPWHSDYRGAPADGSAWSEGGSEERVLRGGSWKDEAKLLASGVRRSASRDLKDDAVGLRCVLDVEAAP